LKNKRKELLDFWTLCEISDFEKFNLSDVSVFKINTKINTKKSYTEYEEYDENYKNKIYLGNKERTIHKIFLGLIESKKAIEYIYDKLKEKGLIPTDALRKAEEDIERLPHNSTYTYMAYIYVDENQNLISISGKSLVVNPLFYIFKNLLDRSKVNTYAYNEYISTINNEFSIKYHIDTPSKVCIIPDVNYLLKLEEYLKAYQFFKKIENSKIYILDNVRKEIELKAEYNDERALAIKSVFDKESKDKGSNFLFFDNHSSYDGSSNNRNLDFAIELAKNRYYDYVYLLLGEKSELNNIQAEIPVNLFFLDRINFKKNQPKQYYAPAVDYISEASESKITNDKLEDIFDDCCNKLCMDNKNLFHNEDNQSLSLFKKSYTNTKIKKIDEIETIKFLSFYMDALKEESSKCSIPYIDGVADKIDINEDNSIRKKYNAFHYFEEIKGRWATKYPLYYAQQMAVNQFLHKLNKTDANIFSVNGPPGTGKTTLLKDVIADIITRRVKHCIELDGEIFDEDNLLKSELCGKYEIIVSSNNNNAVENITRELPKIGEFDFEYLNYSKDTFLLSEYATKLYDFAAWSLVSINLGKSDNINNFSKVFATFKDDIEKSTLLNKSSLNNRKDELVNRIKEIENELNEDAKNFKYLSNIEELKDDKREVDNAKDTIASIESDNVLLEKEKSGIKKFIDTDKEIIMLKESEREEYNLFLKIFSYRKYKDLKKEISSQKRSLATDLLKYQKIEKRLNKQQKELEVLVSSKALIERKYDNQDLDRLIDSLMEESKRCNINDNKFYKQDEKILQESSLYNHERYLKDKALLFGLSMQLSEVYFLLNFDNFCKSIKGYLEKYRKNMISDKRIKLQRYFSALFFLFPVVSTSLASSHKMLENIDTYGTLLCDESGQATPQSLIGLLNRANNALIVGDPMQVEPVFTAPAILIDLIQETYKVKDIYSPVKSSAQRVADNANDLGAFYKVDKQKQWVGMPLVVHRRCVKPMFSISNDISYNSKMVLSTPEIEKNDDINNLPPSGWIDVKYDKNDFHKNTNGSRSEVESLCKFIEKHKAYLKDNYYVISPFRAIYDSKDKLETNESRKMLGTVHTFQGREQDVVFFILGGRTDGAKRWVSGKTNILNVAVTRAKKRIYFIGDYDIWKEHTYFKVAAEACKESIY